METYELAQPGANYPDQFAAAALPMSTAAEAMVPPPQPHYIFNPTGNGDSMFSAVTGHPISLPSQVMHSSLPLQQYHMQFVQHENMPFGAGLHGEGGDGGAFPHHMMPVLQGYSPMDGSLNGQGTVAIGATGMHPSRDDYCTQSSSLGWTHQPAAPVSDIQYRGNDPRLQYIAPAPSYIAFHNGQFQLIAPKTCINCLNQTTSIWRCDGDSNLLCNACGLYLKAHGEARPLSLEEKAKRRRGRDSGAKFELSDDGVWVSV